MIIRAEAVRVCQVLDGVLTLILVDPLFITGEWPPLAEYEGQMYERSYQGSIHREWASSAYGLREYTAVPDGTFIDATRDQILYLEGSDE